MKKPENIKGVTRSFNRINQQGDGNLNSDGMVNAAKPRDTRADYCYNQHAGTQDPNRTFNFGRPAANLTGNTGRDLNAGPKRPPHGTTAPDFRKFLGPQDSLNFGRQERTPGGTRPFEPQAEGNYAGDSDRINSGRGPTRGNEQGTSKARLGHKSGSNPEITGGKRK
jgi:hypothetical protein